MFEKNISLRFLRFLSVDDTSSRGFKRTTKLLTKVLLRDGKKERERERHVFVFFVFSDVCERRTARCGKRKKKETTICDGDLFDFSLFEFDAIFSPAHYTLRDHLTTIFFSGRRGISSRVFFLSPFLSVGRSIKRRRRRRRRRRIRREVCDGGLFGPSLLLLLLLLLLLRAREREREKIHKPPFWNVSTVSLSLSLSRRPKDVCSKKSTFFVGKTDRPFRLFLPSRLNCQNSLTTNERKQTNKKKKQTINLISLTVTKNRFCARRRRWWCRGA